MQIEWLGKGPWVDIDQSDEVVTVMGQAYNLDEIRGDSEQHIEVRDDDGSFIAHIITPPDRHTTIFEGRTDENGDPIPSEVAMPLEMDRVRVILWTKNNTENINLMEEE